LAEKSLRIHSQFEQGVSEGLVIGVLCGKNIQGEKCCLTIPLINIIPEISTPRASNICFQEMFSAAKNSEIKFHYPCCVYTGEAKKQTSLRKKITYSIFSYSCTYLKGLSHQSEAGKKWHG
jgi:hypothetical protein